MDWFGRLVTKKNVLIASGLITLCLLIWNYIGNYAICDSFFANGSKGACPEILTQVGINLLPFLPLFLLSILASFLRPAIFKAWAKFALVWIPFTMLCIAAAPEYSQSLLPIVKGSVAFYLSILFVIISIGIMCAKWLSLKK